MALLGAFSSANLITATLSYDDNAHDPTDAAYTSRRARYEQYLQEGAVAFWAAKEWPWSMRSASLPAPDSDGRTTLPTGFYEIGRSGGVLDTSTQRALRSVDIGELRAYLNSPSGTDKSYVYAIGEGYDQSASFYIWFPKGWSGVTTLVIKYRQSAPVCSDTGTDCILEIPPMYHYTILLNYMKWRALDSVSDPRAAIWYQEYNNNLNRAIAVVRTGAQKDTRKRPKLFANSSW